MVTGIVSTTNTGDSATIPGIQPSNNDSSSSATTTVPGLPTDLHDPVVGGTSAGTAQFVDLVDSPSGPSIARDAATTTIAVADASSSASSTPVRSGAQGSSMPAGSRFISIDPSAAQAHADTISAGSSTSGTPGAPTRNPFEPLPGSPVPSSSSSTSLSLGSGGGAHTLAVALWLVLALMLAAGRSYFKRAFQFPNGITQNLTAPPG